MRIRVLTWNIHKGIGGVDRKYRPERVVEVINHYRPDVALLQEVDDRVKRSAFHRQVDHLGDALDMEHRCYGPNVKVGNGVYGNAMLSKWPLSDVHNIDLTVSVKKKRGVLFARCHVEGRSQTRTLAIFNLHLGLAGFERKIQLRRFLKSHPFNGFRPSTPILVGGDFNDLYGTLGRKLLDPAGFKRAGPLLHTYPAVLPVRALDALHVRGDLKPVRAFRSRMRVAREASDHLPVIADFKLGWAGHAEYERQRPTVRRSK